MNDIQVYLLTGPAGAGKSTAADIIANELDASVLSFADPLRTMLRSAFSIRLGEDKEKPLEALGGRSYRYALQTLGTEWGRNLIHPNIWAITAVNHVREIDAFFDEPCAFVFDDARFQNEIDLMKEAFDARVIKIVPTFEGYQPIEESAHASETQELTWDYKIENSGNQDTFEGQILEVLRWNQEKVDE